MNKRVVQLDEVTKDCCSAWPCVSPGFKWVIPKDHEHRKIMPAIEFEGRLWRVFFCPVCGADVTNVVNMSHR